MRPEGRQGKRAEPQLCSLILALCVVRIATNEVPEWQDCTPTVEKRGVAVEVSIATGGPGLFLGCRWKTPAEGDKAIFKWLDGPIDRCHTVEDNRTRDPRLFIYHNTTGDLLCVGSVNLSYAIFLAPPVLVVLPGETTPSEYSDEYPLRFRCGARIEEVYASSQGYGGNLIVRWWDSGVLVASTVFEPSDPPQVIYSQVERDAGAYIDDRTGDLLLKGRFRGRCVGCQVLSEDFATHLGATCWLNDIEPMDATMAPTPPTIRTGYLSECFEAAMRTAVVVAVFAAAGALISLVMMYAQTAEPQTRNDNGAGVAAATGDSSGNGRSDSCRSESSGRGTTCGLADSSNSGSCPSCRCPPRAGSSIVHRAATGAPPARPAADRSSIPTLRNPRSSAA